MFSPLQVATTVFTPLEFGTVGLSEEKAIDLYGEENIEVEVVFVEPFSVLIDFSHNSSL